MERYQLLAADDACLVFSLERQMIRVAAEGLSPASDPSIVEAIADLASHLLPAAASVAVLTLDTGARVPERMRPWQFPRAARADLRLAAAQLASLEASGYEFLVVPRGEREWLRLHPNLLGFLAARHRLVTRQENLCDVYELRAPSLEPNGTPLFAAMSIDNRDGTREG
jgi:hypothetical protein